MNENLDPGHPGFIRHLWKNITDHVHNLAQLFADIRMQSEVEQ